MSPFAEAIKTALRPRDTRTVVEWGRENIRYIPNSARSNQGFQPDATPWLKEPMEFWGDEKVKEQVLVFPTGAGKTTFFDICIPHCIAENPGDILLSMQTSKDAESHVETRLLPTLRACAPVKKIFDTLNRHALKKSTLVLPHMTVHTAGESKHGYQRISVRYFLADEAWLLKHGYMEEGRARLHSRWNGRVVIVSQGGNESITLKAEKLETELFAAQKRTDQRKWSMVCPECGNVQIWRMGDISYADSADDREVIESAHYICRGRCAMQFEDRAEIRRHLSAASVYQVTNPNHLPHHHGWTAAAPGLFHERWGDLALGWKKANEASKAGDVEPLRIFIQKRLAEFWKEENDAPEVVLGASGYSVADYFDGGLIDGEIFRFAAIDRQRDYFFMGVRAFRADGSSRLLYYGAPTTIEACREIQQRYKVKDDFTAEDASHHPTDVYDDCAKFKWIAMFGDQVNGFDHIPKVGKAIRKLYSPLKKAMASDGAIIRYIRWAATPVKDILFSHLAGRGPSTQVPDDIGDDWNQQIRAEVKREVVSPKTKQISLRYVKTRKRNDACDVEGMLLTFALIKGVANSDLMEAKPQDQPEDPDPKDQEP